MRIRSIALAVLSSLALLSGCDSTGTAPDSGPPKIAFLVKIPGKEIIYPLPNGTVNLKYNETAEITMVVTSPSSGSGIGETRILIGSPTVCTGKDAPLKGQNIDGGQTTKTVLTTSTKFKPEGSKCAIGYQLDTPIHIGDIVHVQLDPSALLNTKFTVMGESHDQAKKKFSNFTFYIQSVGHLL